jgi:hypothetical protein
MVSMSDRLVRAFFLTALLACLLPVGGVGYAQTLPTEEQLNQLLAPIALYPDTLLAQICAASTDPQQVIDANNWVKQNANLQGQALTDAAQKQGFDPAFISLVTFPAVLDTMAINIDDYAALGEAFKANQASVTAAIQALRQQAYASGALDSNRYQQVSVEQQNGAQVVVIQPVNPQVIYVPQYQPQQVFVTGASQSDVVAASLLSFGAGVAIGALISSNQPWGWSAWGWGWGGGGMYYNRNVWHYHHVYVSPRPYYRPRPPVYGRPIYGRPPPNWNQRPGYRPPPPGFRPPIYKPPPAGGRPPGGGGGYKPPPNGGRPPGNGGGPPNNGGKPPANSGGTKPPGAARPAQQPQARPAPQPQARPAPQPQARPAPRPAPSNPYAGFPQGGNRPQAQRPSPQQYTGARPSGFNSDFSGKSERAASDRGKASAGGGKASTGGGNRSGGKPR